MQTLSKNIKQQKSSDYDDRLIFIEVDNLPKFEEVIDSREQKDYLHPNYRHLGWLPKPN
jgi:hypothetical protein